MGDERRAFEIGVGGVEVVEGGFTEGRFAWERSTLNLEVLGRLRGGKDDFCGSCWAGVRGGTADKFGSKLVDGPAETSVDCGGGVYK